MKKVLLHQGQISHIVNTIIDFTAFKKTKKHLSSLELQKLLCTLQMFVSTTVTCMYRTSNGTMAVMQSAAVRMQIIMSIDVNKGIPCSSVILKIFYEYHS